MLRHGVSSPCDWACKSGVLPLNECLHRHSSATQCLLGWGVYITAQHCGRQASAHLQAESAVEPLLCAQEVQRGKQLAERAQSTSKLLREDISRGQRKGVKADGSPLDAAQDPSGVAGLTKRLEDYAAAFEQISTATGARSVMLMQADSETSQ